MHQFLTFHPMTWPQRSRLRFIVLNLSRCAVYIIVSRVSPSVYASLLPLPSGFCYSMSRRPFSPLALIPFAVFSQCPSYTISAPVPCQLQVALSLWMSLSSTPHPSLDTIVLLPMSVWHSNVVLNNQCSRFREERPDGDTFAVGEIQW